MKIINLLKDVEYLYEPVRSLYKSEGIILHLENSKFMIYKPEHGFPNAKFIKVYETRNVEEIYNELIDRYIDLDVLESKLLQALLDEAVYAKLKTEKTLKYFTEDDVNAHLEEWRVFSKMIVDRVEEVCDNKDNKNE